MTRRPDSPAPAAAPRKPAKAYSLRLRLLAGVFVWIAVSAALAGWGLDRLFREQATQQFRKELVLHLDQLTAAFALDGQGQAQLLVPLSDPRMTQPLSGLYWQIDRIDAQGRPLQAAMLRSRSLWDQALPPPPDGLAASLNDAFYEATPGGLPALAVLSRVIRTDGERHGARNWRLLVAADQAVLAAPISRFTNMLIIALGLLSAGMVLAALGLVTGVLRPLSRLRRRVADVHEGRAQHIQGRYPREIQPLVEEFNAVLDANLKIVQRARTQAGNLAHAVKTPLAILDNAARHEPGPLGKLVGEQVGQARRQIDYHLARARAAAAVQAGGLRTPLDGVLQAMARTMRRLYAARQLEITVPSLPASTAFKGEEQDLHEMLGNLLDNACKWARTRVTVSVETGSGSLTLHVDDDGPGLAPGDVEAAFRRGVRLDEQQPGSGLGLHIVAEMAELYQGGIDAGVSPLGGLRMTLRLPAA